MRCVIWLRDYAMERFADARAVLIADPTGFPKKGRKSAAQRQYSGTLERVDNCQIGTFLAYVNTAGEPDLIHRELYIPEESWFGDPGRCAEDLEELTFATRPAQVATTIQRALQAGVPFAWFTADGDNGENPGMPTTPRGHEPFPPTSWLSRRTPNSPTPQAAKLSSISSPRGWHRMPGSVRLRTWRERFPRFRPLGTDSSPLIPFPGHDTRCSIHDGDLLSTTATTRAARASASCSASPAAAGPGASDPEAGGLQAGRWQLPIGSASTTPGTGTSPWPCLPTRSWPPGVGPKRGPSTCGQPSGLKSHTRRNHRAAPRHPFRLPRTA